MIRIRFFGPGELIQNGFRSARYQKSMDQTLNAKMMNENNETFKHDTEFHEFRTARAAGADLQHARMTKDTMTIRKSVIINEYESDKINPNDHNDAVGIQQEGNVTNSQLETGTSRLTYTRRRCTTSNSSRTDLTSRAGQTFSPTQNDRKVQETAKYRDKDEANKQ